MPFENQKAVNATPLKTMQKSSASTESTALMSFMLSMIFELVPFWFSTDNISPIGWSTWLHFTPPLHQLLLYLVKELLILLQSPSQERSLQ